MIALLYIKRFAKGPKVVFRNLKLLTLHPSGPSVFTDHQKQVLMTYYEKKDMKSTHKRNNELMDKAAKEAGTTLERVKVNVYIIVMIIIWF